MRRGASGWCPGWVARADLGSADGQSLALLPTTQLPGTALSFENKRQVHRNQPKPLQPCCVRGPLCSPAGSVPVGAPSTRAQGDRHGQVGETSRDADTSSMGGQRRDRPVCRHCTSVVSSFLFPGVLRPGALCRVCRGRTIPLHLGENTASLFTLLCTPWILLNPHNSLYTNRLSLPASQSTL